MVLVCFVHETYIVKQQQERMAESRHIEVLIEKHLLKVNTVDGLSLWIEVLITRKLRDAILLDASHRLKTGVAWLTAILLCR